MTAAPPPNLKACLGFTTSKNTRTYTHFISLCNLCYCLPPSTVFCRKDPLTDRWSHPDEWAPNQCLKQQWQVFLVVFSPAWQKQTNKKPDGTDQKCKKNKTNMINRNMIFHSSDDIPSLKTKNASENDNIKGRHLSRDCLWMNYLPFICLMTKEELISIFWSGKLHTLFYPMSP